MLSAVRIPVAAFITLVVGLMLPGAALAEASGPYVEKATGFVFPEQVGKFRRGAVTEFPDKRMGVGVGYAGPGRAEIFIYDFGIAEIPTGVDSEVVRKAFTQAEAGIERMLRSRPDSNAQKFAEAAPIVEADGREARLLAALYTWTFKGAEGRGGPMATCVLVTGVKNKLVKVLYTAPAPDPASAQGDLKDLVLGLLEANPDGRGAFMVEKKAP